MISVAEAEGTVLGRARNFGSETVDLELATGRVLAEDIRADRDLPPYDRVTMDGYAVKYADFASGRRTFPVKAVQAAGDPPGKLASLACIQVMTGAALPAAADTVIAIEDTEAGEGGMKVLADKASKGQYVHYKGSDAGRGRILVPAGQVLTAAAVSLAAASGQAAVAVRKLPRVVVVTTGDELVDVRENPTDYQIRRSNNYAVKAAVDRYGAAVDILHMADDVEAMSSLLGRCLKQYDAVIISGGVSKGSFDYVPGVLAGLSVDTLFHGVQQRPGKPFLFGAHPDGPVVFACPGNPVSTMLCVYKYILPWLRACLGAAPLPERYAVLDRDVLSPEEDFSCFAQVKLRSTGAGILYAAPIANNGSGDFLSLLQADAFLELPPGKRRFKKGEAYKTVALETIL